MVRNVMIGDWDDKYRHTAAATPPMPIIPVTWLPASMPVSGIPIACVVFGANCDV